MNSNVESIDRIIRLILGCALLAASLSFKSWWGLVGFVPLLTAIFRFCPFDTLVGINTGPRK